MAGQAPYPRHPNAVILPPAVVVSPLIRAARYVSFGLGLLWGYWRMSRICEHHADVREFVREKQLLESQRKSQVKAWDDKEQTKMLMKVQIFLTAVAVFG
uniref:ATP synthase F(0) complex subunit e, mitochondrial n=1 Tax=Syphacia muris TaxID=451379 RepID=A0A0N5AS55_9BILA